MTHWKQLILQNDPVHKYVTQMFLKQNLFLVHVICTDIFFPFSIPFHFNTLCHFIKKRCLQPNNMYIVRSEKNDKDYSRFAWSATVAISYI